MTKSWRYLYKLSTNIYNNRELSYEVIPLPFSDQKRVQIFSGKSDKTEESGTTYIYIELSKELNAKNNYANFQRLLNLIYMETGLPTHFISVPIDESKTFKEVLSKFASKNYYYPSRSYSGTAPQPDHIARVKTCVNLMSGLDKDHFDRFDNALNTYVWALELMELPNPHLKYTLYMTLFLSSINQLASDPTFCSGHPNCPVCGREVSHQLKGERQAIVDLINELLTGKEIDVAAEMIKRLYSDLRSHFLHSGLLSGKEKNGGFLTEMGDSTKIIEDMVNVLIMNRRLLEQFLVKRQVIYENSN